MSMLWTIVIILAYAFEANALDLKTTNDITFIGISIISNKTDSTGITFTHSRGVAKIAWDNLTEEDRQKFGYRCDKSDKPDLAPLNVEPPIYSENLPSNDEISKMDFETRVKWAKTPPPFRKNIRNAQEMISVSRERERFLRTLNAGLTRVQADALRSSLNPVWTWPNKEHRMRIFNIEGIVQEIRERSNVEFMSSELFKVGKDWIIVEMKDTQFKETFRVFYHPVEKQRLEKYLKGSLLKVGPGFAIEKRFYIPEIHWNVYANLKNDF